METRNPLTPGPDSPCRSCQRPCNYTQCRPYRIWLNTCWNRYRRWQEPRPKQVRRPDDQVWRYNSPVLLHDFLEQGPCKRCGLQKKCHDLQSCEAYNTWVDLRWERLRKKLGYPAAACRR